MSLPILTWFGGKVRMAPTLVKIIMDIPHSCYVEPFAGGAAVFFSIPYRRHAYIATGEKADMVYALNDKSMLCANVYRCAQRYPEEFAHMAYYTLHSQADFSRAVDIIKEKKAMLEHNSEPDLELAWAMYVISIQGFASIPTSSYGSWGKSRKDNSGPVKTFNRSLLLPELFERLRYVHIDHVDALDCIRRWDSPNTLFFCDPPYINTRLDAYYGTYTEDDHRALCDTLDKCQGSYVMTNYNNDIVPQTATSIIPYTNRIELDRRKPSKDVTEYIFIGDRTLPFLQKGLL